jgi:hypothetical protein
MELYAIVEGVRRKALQHEDGTYKCFPKNTNTVDDARIFNDLRDAAIFLLRNPEWGIRMTPGSAILYEDIHISRR